MEIILGILIIFVLVSIIGKVLKLAFKLIGLIIMVLVVLFLAGALGLG